MGERERSDTIDFKSLAFLILIIGGIGFYFWYLNYSLGQLGKPDIEVFQTTIETAVPVIQDWK